MPSTSPGTQAPSTPSSFLQILPGAPSASLQGLTSFTFRHKRYIVYISGRQVNLLTSPTVLVQALTFDDDLLAVTAEDRTGKVVISSKKEVWVLEPLTEGWTKVWWEKTLHLVREDAEDTAHWLSWGIEGELLVGGSTQLSLFSTLPSSRTSSPADASTASARVEQRRALWSIGVSSAVQFASFSPSGCIIASCGRHDRMVKIWRRLSFEEGLFDYTYLPHPGAVTHLEWRPLDENFDEHRDSGVSGRHEEDPEILYTIANDGVLRVWKTGNLHDLDILMLHTSINLSSAIPGSPSLTAKGDQQSLAARYSFTLPSEQFYEAVTSAIGLRTEKLSHSLEHLVEMSSKEPDVIVTLDGHGRMSAWGVQSIGHKRRPETPYGYSKHAFHIAHAEGLPLRLEEGTNARIEAWFDDSKINILVHSFGGYIQWWQGDVESFFSPSIASSERLQEIAYWSGHQEGQIEALSGSAKDQNLLSCSAFHEVALWEGAEPNMIQNKAVYTSSCKVLDIAFLAERGGTVGDALVLEAAESDSSKIDMSLRDAFGSELDRHSCNVELNADDNSSWRIFSPSQNDGGDIEGKQVIVALSNKGQGFMLTINKAGSGKSHMENVVSFSIPLPEQCDPLMHAAAILNADDPYKIGIVCVSKAGSLLLYHLELADGSISDPLNVATFESGVKDSSILAATNEFAAVVSSDRTMLAIVNLRDGYVEHRQSRGGQIRHIVPAPKHNLVAVGYDTSVSILAQGRYEHHDEMPPWTLIKQVSIVNSGLSITALTWLGDGSLALAAGNGIFISSNDVAIDELHPDVKEAIDAKPQSLESCGLSDLSQQLRKPLPVWHPSLLAHTVRHGHWGLAFSIVNRLREKIRFWSEGDELHPLCDIPVETLYRGDSEYNETVFDHDLVTDLMQQLDEKDLPEVSQSEQQRLKRVLHAMSFCSEHVRGLDNGALRFLFSWRLEVLHSEDTQLPNGTGANGVSHHQGTATPEMHWREIAFAYHSATQQPLLDILFAHYDNKITWEIARRLGLFAWLADREALDRIFEALAQSAYRASSPPDPINASLYFLALHKKPTLLALWRIATWHKEQRATINFLRRDFTQADSQTAAKKNAYALMGKKRFDYAAAFFLLADDATSATSVLASQCGDIMLAIAVGRLYSGDGSSVLRKLLEDRFLPQAKEKGDRWLESWCHSILLEKDWAADALVRPLEGVRSWRQDDPNTLTLYRQLRGDESEHEYDAILRSARILRRMGLWLLALELVSQWEFKPPPTPTIKTKIQNGVPNGEHEVPPSTLDSFVNSASPKEPPSMLDGFESLKPALPVQDEKGVREAKAAELLKKMKAKKGEKPIISEKKQEPTQFNEPDSNSLLDSFGF